MLTPEHVAIDFIDRLLAKNPATRMTLTQALNHPWLLPPGSDVDSQSQQASLATNYPLGSTAFDLRASRSTSNTVGPSTSATEDANEDCSFPMTNLHIRTPALDRTIQNTGADIFASNADSSSGGQSSFWGNQPRLSGIQIVAEDESLSSFVPESHPISQERPPFALFSQPPRSVPRARGQPPGSVILQESPPSPPLTDSAMEDVSSLPGFVEESPGSLPEYIEETPADILRQGDARAIGVEESVNTIAVTISSPERHAPGIRSPAPLSAMTSGSILKRKRSDESMESQASSDLSPVPESLPQFAGINASNFQDEVSAETTPKASKKRAADMKAVAIPTRSSARLKATQQTGSGSSSPRTPKTTPKARKT
jgi:serine/threonine protein kinase